MYSIWSVHLSSHCRVLHRNALSWAVCNVKYGDSRNKKYSAYYSPAMETDISNVAWQIYFMAYCFNFKYLGSVYS